jgi:hypothetical protein
MIKEFMSYKYCVAKNWGKGFIKRSESECIQFAGFPGDVWRIPAYNKNADVWVTKVDGIFKTKEEAQAIVNAEVELRQKEWDVSSEEDKRHFEKFKNIILK